MDANTELILKILAPPVAGAIAIWIWKSAISAMKSYVTKEVEKRIGEAEGRISKNEGVINELREDIRRLTDRFEKLIDRLIQRNS